MDVGDYKAIADAGKTLVALLQDRMADLVTDDQVVLASPVDEDLANDVRLTLFLFDVGPVSPTGRGESRVPTGETRQAEPLRLALRYLLTAHPGKTNSSATVTTESTDAHTVLGRAMQVLHDEAIVEVPDLQGSLAPDGETLRVSALPESDDVVRDVWNTFRDEPYRPSVAYHVTPVEIESRREEPAERVQEATFEGYAPAGDADE